MYYDIVIVGGGATGVELAAELIEAYRSVNDSMGSAQRFRLRITLVEAGPRLLNGLPDKVAEHAQTALRGKEIDVRTATKVLALHPGRIETDGGDIAADVIVWAAGIKAAERNRAYGLAVNRMNQFEVDARLQTSAPDIYALGDCAACAWQDGKLVPARAQAAHQQAVYLFRYFRARHRGQEYGETFQYRDFGSLISLGTNHGIGNLMGSLRGGSFFIEGLIAKYMYISLHLKYHHAILGYRKTALLALARAAQKRVSGRLKLH